MKTPSLCNALLVTSICAALNAFAAAPPTVQEAKKFLDDAEEKILVLSTEASHADDQRLDRIRPVDSILGSTRALMEGSGCGYPSTLQPSSFGAR